MENNKPSEENGICFGGGNPTGAFGILGGVLIALGVPYIALAYGQPLGTGAQITIAIIGAASGALVSLVSAFFAIVMPSRIAGRMMNPEHWMRMAQMAHAHKHAKWEARYAARFGHAPRMPWEDDKPSEPAAAPEPPAPPRRRRTAKA
jgi:hypothetical protein